MGAKRYKTSKNFLSYDPFYERHLHKQGGLGLLYFTIILLFFFLFYSHHHSSTLLMSFPDICCFLLLLFSKLSVWLFSLLPLYLMTTNEIIWGALSWRKDGERMGSVIKDLVLENIITPLRYTHTFTRLHRLFVLKRFRWTFSPSFFPLQQTDRTSSTPLAGGKIFASPIV